MTTTLRPPLTEHPSTLAERWRNAYHAQGLLPPCPFCSNRGERSPVLTLTTIDGAVQVSFRDCPHTINLP